MGRVPVVLLAVVAGATAAIPACGGGRGGITADAAAGIDHPAPPTPYARPAYLLLSETGLFAGGAGGNSGAGSATSPGVLSFQPAYQLWSDAAEKRRWIALPPGTRIASSDMDHWRFPVGTKLWKEFSRDGVSLETRLIERYGDGPEDYWMGAFVWSADGADAVLAVEGAKDVGGTTHDVPGRKDCEVCHRGEPGRVLGFSAIQLSGAADETGLRLSQLSARGLLSQQPTEQSPQAAGYPVTGDGVTKDALGYLHANCGHCHNRSGIAWHDTQMVLRLRIAAASDPTADASEVLKSNVGRDLQYWRGGEITLRVAPGHPDASALLARMKLRGSDQQMPSLGTELVDAAGMEKVRRWIAALPPVLPSASSAFPAAAAP